MVLGKYSQAKECHCTLTLCTKFTYLTKLKMDYIPKCKELKITKLLEENISEIIHDFLAYNT
jgi:hypothetical protein